MDPTLLGAPVPVPTPQAHKKGLSRTTLLMLVGLIVAIAVGLLLIFVSGDNTGTTRQKLGARSDATLSLVADGKKNIQSPELAKLNSELSLVLLTDDAATDKALTTAGLKKIDPSIKSAEAVTEKLATLKAAKVNGQYDTTYKKALRQQLASLNTLSKQLHDDTNSKSLRAALTAQYAHVAQYQKQLDALSL